MCCIATGSFDRKRNARSPAQAARSAFAMALTNYVVQLVFLEGVLGSRGLGTGVPTWSIPIVCVAFIGVQVIASQWWLARFRFGPIEWLWRSFTYGAFQRIRRHDVPELAASVV